MKKIGIARLLVIFSLVMVLAATFVMGACSKPAPAPVTPAPAPVVEKPIEAKVTHCFAPESWPGHQPVVLKEHVEKATNGRVQVTVYPSAQMFATGAEEVQACMSGIIEFGYMNINHLAAYDGRWNCLTAPGCVYGWDHIQRIHFESPLYKTLNDELAAQTGAKILYWAFDIPYGDCPWNTKRPLVTPEDWKGLKLRSAPSEIQQETIKAFDASPVVLQTAEVLAALSQGVVDGGIITPAAGLSAWSATETLPYLTIPYGGWSITNMFVGFLVNVKWWNSLPQDIRDAIEAELPAMARQSEDETLAASNKLLDKYKAVPTNTITYLTEEQTEVWRALLDKEVLPNVAEKHGCSEIFKEFQKYRP